MLVVSPVSTYAHHHEITSAESRQCLSSNRVELGPGIGRSVRVAGGLPTWKELYRGEEVTGLGREMTENSNRLTEAAMERTLEVLTGFSSLLQQLQPAGLAVVGTSACRRAVNREQFFDRVAGILGIRPRLLSGPQEAEYAYRGAVGSLPPEMGPVLVVDIGGGSTEFGWEEDGRFRFRLIEIGSVRFLDQLVQTDFGASSWSNPPVPAPILEQDIKHLQHRLGSAEPGWSGLKLVGVAGTWTTLASLRQGEVLPSIGRLFPLHRADIEGLFKQLSVLGIDQVEALPGMVPARAPVILSGSAIAWQVAELVSAAQVLVSTSDLLDGVAAELLHAVQEVDRSSGGTR